MFGLTKRLSRMVRATGYRFLVAVRKNPNVRFEPDAYYLTLGTILLDLKPYYGWKNARRAAKRIHNNAFIMRGSTVNRHIEKSQYAGHKKAWSIYAN